MKFPVGESKKNAKFWAPPPFRPTLLGSTLRAPTPLQAPTKNKIGQTNAVWPNSVNNNWPNSAKQGWQNAANEFGNPQLSPNRLTWKECEHQEER